MAQEMMKAGVLVGPRQIRIKEVHVPAVGPGQIKIKVSACGVCGSDIHMWKAGKGWGPDNGEDFFMGHEFCGVVTDPGDSAFSVGNRVVFWANLYCGKCDMCLAGQEQLCREVDGTNYIGFVCNSCYSWASSAFVYTKAPNSGSRRCRELLFLLVGKHPKPFEQTTTLVWLRGFAAFWHASKG